MISSSKKKAHVACSCRSCKRGKGTDWGQSTMRAVEKAYRKEARLELNKAVQELDRDALEEIDVRSQSGTPYLD